MRKNEQKFTKSDQKNAKNVRFLAKISKKTQKKIHEFIVYCSLFVVCGWLFVGHREHRGHRGSLPRLVDLAWVFSI